MDRVINEGQKVFDDEVALWELRGLVVDIGHVDIHDSIVTRLADRDRIKLMQAKYARGAESDRHGVNYGRLLYDNTGVDQVAYLIERLRRKRETKSATVTFHSPGTSVLSCISLIDCKIREEKLEMATVYRSQNVYGSLPGNALVLWEICSHISREVQAPVGLFRLFVLSAHIYEADIVKARTCVSQAREGIDVQ